ncbi:MAG: hypothetical protein ACR2GY_08130 [Phycisphaerales bacterium]
MSYFANADEELQRVNAWRREAGFREDWKLLASSTIAGLGDVLGAAHRDQLKQQYDRELEALRAQRRAAQHDPEGVLTSGMINPDVLQLLPGQMTRRSVEEACRLLQVDEDIATLIRHAHQEYITGLRTLRAEQIEAIIQQPLAFRESELSYMRPPTEQEVTDAVAALDAADRAILALHQAFERDVLALLRDDVSPLRVALFRLSRAIADEAAYRRRSYLHNSYEECRANLVTTLTQAELTEEIFNAAGEILVEAAPRIEAALRRHRRAHREFEAASLRAHSVSQQLRAEGASSDTILNHPVLKEGNAAEQELLQARLQVLAINRSLLEEMDAVIEKHATADDLSARERLTRAYRHEAFSTLYEGDVDSALHLMQRAAAIANLSDEQRHQLGEAAASLTLRYEAAVAEMARVQADSPYQGVPQGQESWIDEYTRRQEAEKLRFARDHINAEARTTVEKILTPDQLQQLNETAPK